MKKFLFTIILLTSVLLTFAQTNLSVTNVNSTDVTLNWDDGFQINMCTNANYQFRYKEVSNLSWEPTITIPNTPGSQSYTLDSLNTSTTYNWKVKCGNGGSWVNGTDFTTASCNITSSISTTNASCSGLMNGSAILTVIGGTSPYTFSWDNGDTTQNLSGILSGIYSVIIVDNVGCTDTLTDTIGIDGATSIQQNISAFLPNPVTAYNQWSYDTLQMINTGCEVRVRPEFEVSCSAGNIQQGDLTIKWTIPGQAGGINIPYTINTNGNAEGFWSQIAGDSTGYLLPYSGNYTLVIKVKFSNPPGTAQYGTYTAYWETFEVDNLGNKIGSLSPQDTVSLSLIDYCSTFSINSVSSDSTSCPSGNNGSAEVITINSGSGNYTYSWSNGSTTNPATNLSAGTYSVIVTDTTYNCSDTADITVIDGSGSSTILDSIIWTDISCNGSTNGSAEVIINTGGSGGSFTGSYCSSGPTQNFYSNIESIRLIGDVDTINNNTAGTCDMYEDYTTMSTNLTAGQSYSMRVDLGTCDPQFAFMDAAKVFVDWNIDGDFDDVNEEVQLVGPTQSPSTNTFSFTVPSSALSGTTRMRVVCQNYTYNGNSTVFGPCDNTVWFGATEDYSLVINAAGISATYLWNNGDTTNIISGLAAGSYWCTVSDQNNCSTTTDTIFISEPSAIFVTDSITHIQCYGDSTGSIDISVSGGINPYTYLWNNGSTTQDLSNITAGTYSVTVTDNNGCVDSITVTLTEPNPINLSITGVVDILCYGDSTGSIDISVSGGINPYTYLWNNGSTTQDLSNITAGTYNLTVTDSNGCVDSITITLTEPNVLSSIITPTHVTSCVIFNGSIALTVTGGVPSYTYSWTGPGGPYNTEDLSGLASGTYSVIVTDANNCTTTNNTIIEQPSNGLTIDTLVSPTYNGYNISCNGGNNGNITATASGGLGNLSFAWTGTGGPYSTQNLTNIGSGTYSVTVTDSLGCSVSDNITLNEPSELSSVYSTTNVLCNGDSTGGATVVFSGGVYWTTPPFATYVLSWTGYTYPLLGGLTTFITPVGVPAGIYPYSATDGNGCMHFDTITITEPTAITVSSSTTNVSCNGGNDGTATLTLSGGTGTLTEDWGTNNPMALAEGTYTYTVTDANLCVDSGSITITEPTVITVSSSTTNVSCNGGNDGTATLTLSGGTGTLTEDWGTNNPMALAEGTYTYTVTDANLCVDSGFVTITEPSEITITNSVIDVSVYNGNDGSIYISSNGGVGNYTYNWIGPNGYVSNTDDISSLYSGNYIITVTDAANCSNSDTIFVDQPSLPSTLSVTIDTVINIICFGACNGQIDITPDGGDSVYTYLWTGPNGFSSTNEDLNNLCAGTYELIISDTTSSVYDTIVVVQPTELQIITNVDTALCYGSTAQASAFTYGGQNPYTTNWDNGSSSITTYLTAGIHYVNVMDFNGCTVSDTINIIQNDSMSLATTNTDISCYGLTDGLTQINVDSGGVSAYSYSDDNGINFQSNNIFSNLAAGTSIYIVMDANGCTNSISGIINEPEELVVTLSSTNVSCNGGNDGTAIANISGGTSPYIIDTSWGGLDPNNLSVGLVNVTVIDSNGCLATNYVIITEPPPVIVMITVNGDTLEATPGFPSYQWIDETGNDILGATSQSYIPTTAGEYAVQVIDSNGCTGKSIKINFIIESVGDISSHLSIYPNPTNSWITIETKVEINSDIKILNIFGEVVETIDYELFNDKFEKINMSEFSKGIYIIQLINNQSIINHKIILQ